MTTFFRMLIGLIVMIFPGILGWYFRNPAIILILGALYVPFYFFGKMKTWAAIGYTPTHNALVKAIPVTFLIQTVLAGLFYLIGRGLGTFFADYEMAPALTALDASWIVGFIALTVPLVLVTYFLERRVNTRPTSIAEAKQPETDPKVELDMGEDDDFGIYARKVTPDTFFRGPHSSYRDATGIALKDILDYDGNRPKRVPKQASDAMIADAEQRLGVRLPATLRTLYGIRNGGHLYTYYVPRTDDAPYRNETWVSAFADDYNDLKPLARLELLQADYDEHFDPNYNTDEDKAHWIAGADKLVVIAARSGYGTALDYRKGPEPGVLLFDHQNEPGEAEILKFESFDSFFAALREVKFENIPGGREIEPTAYGGSLDSDDPEDFWISGNPGAVVTQDAWAEAGQALGVMLPKALLPFYRICNGGQTKFIVALPDSEHAEPVRVFPTGRDRERGTLLPVEQFVSLAALSDRIDFVDNRTPWRDLFGQPDKFIVISAAYDSVILLDYTVGPDPAVRAISDLDNPESANSFHTVEAFLTSLRRYGIEERDMRNAVGDPKISVRQTDPSTFWMRQPDRAPVPRQVQNGFIEKWGFQNHGLPRGVESLYKIQNGGAVQFRFAPPQNTNPHGYKNYDPTAKEWIDIFPDGLLAMEFWQPFADWRKTHRLADGQSMYEFTNRVREPYDGDTSDTKLNLFVIGDHTSPPARMVTILDMSTGPFVNNRNLMTLRYDTAADRFETVFGPMMIDNTHSGFFSTVRAYKSDL